MISKLYLFFIKTKYSKFNRDDVLNLRKANDAIVKLGLNASILTISQKEAIEHGVLGRVLSLEERKIDAFVLTNQLPIRAFIATELEKVSEESLDDLSMSVDCVRKSILKNMSSRGRAQAIEMGLV